MALLVKRALRLYDDIFTQLPDRRVEHWWLMGTPWPLVGLLVVYLYAALVAGPKLMKKRRAMRIDRLLVAYNAAQICCCGYIVVEGIRFGLIDYNFFCAPIQYGDGARALHVGRLMWLYFVLKVIDLLDTIFFIVRKKDKQVTFLHVYHHWGMVGLSWLIVKFLPGGIMLYIVVINCFVHIIMYMYYLLTAYDKSYSNSLWWKKHLTQLQLIQFGVILVQHVQLLLFQTDCDFPRWIFWGLIPQNLTIFALFAEFYYATYASHE